MIGSSDSMLTVFASVAMCWRVLMRMHRARVPSPFREAAYPCRNWRGPARTVALHALGLVLAGCGADRARAQVDPGRGGGGGEKAPWATAEMAADGGLHSRRAPGRLEPGADASTDVPRQDWRAPGDGKDGGSAFDLSRWLADRGLARGQLGPSRWDGRKATVICDCSGVVVVRSQQNCFVVRTNTTARRQSVADAERFFMGWGRRPYHDDAVMPAPPRSATKPRLPSFIDSTIG